jgi:NAD(P)-dependent dehydrogenase (short-subunit alcohol dehydrogenase family)
MSQQTAIITGSSSGMGAATAVLLAARGWNVTVNAARSLKEAEAVAKQCTDGGSGAIVVAGDVSEDADCRRVVSETMKAFGRLDALVNNAAVTKYCALSNLDGLCSEDFQRMTAVNVAGPFMMARAAAPALRQSGHGAIVNVTSNAGLTGVGSSIAYAASKAALNTLTLSLARALAPEIRVNAVAPGFTVTPWHSKGMSDEAVANLTAHFRTTAPLKRNTTAEDIANTILWFIEGASGVTGQIVVVDSGNHLHTNAPPAR